MGIPNTVPLLKQKIIITNIDCWELRLKKRKDGYRQVRFGGQKVYSHRLFKEYYHGNCPLGMICDHLCRNRGCCNPDHIEYVTPAENTQRSPIHPCVTKPQQNKTHCPAGHSLSGDNVYYRKDRPGRECRICRQLRQKVYGK